MRLLKLELKRVLKTRTTWILLSLSLLLTILMAYLPITFDSIQINENGTTVELKGLDYISYIKELQKDSAGIVTPDKIRRAVLEYQACLSEYGVEISYELPEEVYYERIMPHTAILHCVREAFADPDTGYAPSIMDIDADRIEDFYAACRGRIESLMKMEQKNHPAAQSNAIAMYDKVELPFALYPGYTMDAMDYQTILIFLIAIFTVIITAPIFSSDYQTGADDIMRCTKNGRIRLGAVKIISAFIICVSAFALCSSLYLLISNSLFGWECTKSSIQMLYSAVSLPAFNLGELQWAIVLASLVSLLAVLSLTLFISSKCKSTFVSLSLGILFAILPFIVYMSVPGTIGTWLLSILPSSGVNLQSSYQFALTDFEFLNIGNVAIWRPYAMIGFTIAETLLFTGLTLHSYCSHKIK